MSSRLMSANAHFAEVPTLKIQRSVFDRSCSNKTTLNTGDLVPLYVDEVLPGDTVSLSFNSICRQLTLLKPIFDDLYLNVYCFFCS